ncbi:Biotin carboxylase of acetyl-CoA carboxylase / Biotin carboxyl carrier protein of acetyl-CoA carboxylase Propionyl-CoA carboxylase alpha chain [Paramagnetospirillum magnetotacticum MS-1]|uniref:Biotin carboxylase n=1 Tax=Paramagnetospirillum magnetotacticum MS-1 TaxID=272627 RepID=A0A0C2YQP4_PARME|nr:acetyl-CoA carboxylase biotin carboxylase subunit [Paramagnetospirillum magnetotacticum]KIL97443.1 Biotin carboxylase of acetyl-CoA carboxylase / Biotin carboxyl carrier protein of acetyl-CoA carboxylase Propionyl-CoA carboxylase alpha chain [Paramagnetospirillum magnetotacticum MS-1]
MFTKILIANRGEIACRVIKTARKMGIKTVAVYSDADKDALHVSMADEAVHIGPAASAQSYLVIDKIVEACKKTGAQAVHPGYGFLSEKREFQEALGKAGIAFIGPDAHAIFAMGDKIESKKLAREAGVNTVPGYLGVIKDADEAVKIAREIGYPVMLKASAGGGGKGMRLAWNDAEAHEGFTSATNEAKTSFGDDRVFVEKFIEQPRHIEIQVLADGQGTVLYLGERECSIQRRHQKVIEEAPSPFLTPETRKAMGEQACALARIVNYKSAGTVEFIVGGATGEFYFLEMNTRLQVEHPVTEMITGLDLVEQMIRVAYGEKLKITQDDVKLQGWSMEARVYAEDPFRNFLPSTGRLTRYQPPAESQHVRVDTGVYEGGEISMFYDPMIAKLITYGPTRETAIAHMRQALDEYHIRGLSHNIPFLASLFSKERFVKGNLTTNFIAEEYPNGFTSSDLPSDDPTTLIAVAAAMKRRIVERNIQISGQFPGHEMKAPTEWTVLIGGTYHEVDVHPAPGGYAVVVEGEAVEVKTDWQIGDPLIRAKVDDRMVCVQVDRTGVSFRLSHSGVQAEVWVLTRPTAKLHKLMPFKAPPDMSKYLLSPMPGLLAKLLVEEGQEVKAGEPLAVVEAMKMENILKAERDAKIAKVHAKSGDSLAVDQKIIEFAS